MSVGLWAMGMTVSGTSVLDSDRLPHQYHEDSTNPLVNEYRTRDGGFIALAFLQSDRYFPEFCVLVDRYDWLADDRFTDSAARAEHSRELVRLLDELFLERDLAEWQELLSKQDGQWDTVLPAGQVQYDEQALANGYVQRVEHEATARSFSSPPPCSSTARRRRLARRRPSARIPTTCFGRTASRTLPSRTSALAA